MATWLWDKKKSADWYALWDYIEGWCLIDDTFWYHEDVQALNKNGKIKAFEYQSFNVINQCHDNPENFGFKNIDNISIFKKAAILIELLIREPIFMAKEHAELTKLEEWCILVCNYRCAWDLAFLYIYRGSLSGDNDSIKKMDKKVTFPSDHLQAEILEQDTNGQLSVPARALLLETIAYLYHDDIPGHRDKMTCDNGCDPYFL